MIQPKLNTVIIRFAYFLVFGSFLASTCFSQPNQPFKAAYLATYRMFNVPDSTARNNVQSSYMALLIGENKSLFTSEKFLFFDSVSTAIIEKKIPEMQGIALIQGNGGVPSGLQVYKTNSTIATYDWILRTLESRVVHGYLETQPLVTWTIRPDTMRIGTLTCQKAETKLGGRMWTAWFTSQIPLSDGPYKFSGLPGLIVNIADATNSWKFELVKFTPINRSVKITMPYQKIAQIKDKQTFLRLRRNELDNKFVLEKAKGVTYSNEAFYQKLYKDEARADNNWIEFPE